MECYTKLFNQKQNLGSVIFFAEILFQNTPKFIQINERQYHVVNNNMLQIRNINNPWNENLVWHTISKKRFFLYLSDLNDTDVVIWKFHNFQVRAIRNIYISNDNFPFSVLLRIMTPSWVGPHSQVNYWAWREGHMEGSPSSSWFKW